MQTIVWLNQGDLHVLGGQFLNTLMKTISETMEQGRATCCDNRVVKLFAQIDVALFDS